LKAGIKDVLTKVMRVQFWNIMRIAKKPISKTTSTFRPRTNKPRNFLNWIWLWWVSKESSLDKDSKKVNLPLWQNAPKRWLSLLQGPCYQFFIQFLPVTFSRCTLSLW
jgi:hypothetical protein